VSKYFSNVRDGMAILKQVLTQLLLYYTRFQASSSGARCCVNVCGRRL
jgi:hypothetical protein